MKTLYPCRECAKRFLDNAWTQNNNADLQSNYGKLVLRPIGTTGEQSNNGFAWSLGQRSAAMILEQFALTKEFASI